VPESEQRRERLKTPHGEPGTIFFGRIVSSSSRTAFSTEVGQRAGRNEAADRCKEEQITCEKHRGTVQLPVGT